MLNLVNLIPTGRKNNIYAMQLPDKTIVNGKFNTFGYFITSFNVYIPHSNGRWLVTKRMRHIKNDLEFQTKRIKEIEIFKSFIKNLKK